MPRYPISSDEELGEAKIATLEYFARRPGWHAASVLKEDSQIGTIRFVEDSRAIQMRLLRYVRQGLLRRRRKHVGYEYTITMKGEDYLFYLWEKTNADNNNRDNEGSNKGEYETSKKEFLELKLAILERRKARILTSQENES